MPEADPPLAENPKNFKFLILKFGFFRISYLLFRIFMLPQTEAKPCAWRA
jgi:hypothetical protein